jgi:CheY-like chemotaxis protein
MMADILVIDDDPQMRRLIARILMGASHAVREAADGRKGLALVREQRPDLVVCDLVMPDMEGIETILTLRSENAGLPIIAISGGNDPLYLNAASKLGASASLGKPFSPDELLNLVADLLDAPTP